MQDRKKYIAGALLFILLLASQLFAAEAVFDKPFQAKEHGKNRTASVETKVDAQLNGTVLSIQFDCSEPSMNSLKTREMKHDSLLMLNNDCVAIYIDPLNTGDFYYMICCNASGSIFDARIAADRNVDTSWQSNAKVNVTKDAMRYQVKLDIPLKSLGAIEIGANDVWGINAGRMRKGEKPEDSFLVPETYFVHIGTSQFPAPQAKQMLPFIPKKSKSSPNDMSLVCRERGISHEKDSVVKFEATCENKLPGKITVCSYGIKKDGEKNCLGQKTTSIPSKATTGINIRYKLDDKYEKVIFSVQELETKEVLYESIYEAPDSFPDRVYRIKGSYKPELVEKKEDVPFSAYWWPQVVFDGKYKSACQRYGFEYNPKEIMARCVKAGLLPIMQAKRIRNTYNSLWHHEKELRASSTPIVLMPRLDNYSLLHENLIRGGKRQKAFWADQQAQDEYMTHVDEGYKKYGDMIAAFFVGDEDYHWVARAGLDLWQNKQKEYPGIKTVYEEIKKDYGFNRYSIPGKADRERLNYVAYCRWLNDKLGDFQKKIAKHVRKIKPETVIIGDDSGYAHNFNRFKKDIDIFSFQESGSKPTPFKHAAMVKFYHDVTGGKNIWGCHHLKYYNVKDLHEIMSACFQVGERGYLIFDLSAPLGFPSAWQFTAPERWQYLLRAMEFYKEGHRAKLPEANGVGVMFAVDNALAYPGCFGSPNPRDIWYPFAALGPLSKGWFTFFEDSEIIDDPQSLDKYKTVFVPRADFIQKKAVVELLEAVKNGMTLVLCTPQAFDLDIDGTNHDDLRKKFAGDIAASKCKEKVLRLKSPDGKMMEYNYLPWDAPCFFAGTIPTENIFLRYDNGQTAAVNLPYGKGRIVWFGFNLFSGSNIDDPDWIDYYRHLSGELGMKTDYKIWSLKLPDFAKKIPLPSTFCLSNNNVYFRQDIPFFTANQKVSGTYSYSYPPDKIADIEMPNAKAIRFENGKLTDRARSAKDYSKIWWKIKKGIVAWSKLDETEIVFDLKKQYAIQKVNLFLTENIPGIELQTSSDALKWHSASRLKPGDETDNIVKLSLRAGEPASRYLKLIIKNKKRKLTLNEVEIWGNDL